MFDCYFFTCCWITACLQTDSWQKLLEKNWNIWWIFHRFFLGDRCGNDWPFPRTQRLKTKKLYNVCQFLEVLGIYLIDWTDICFLLMCLIWIICQKFKLCFQMNFHWVCEFTPYINLASMKYSPFLYWSNLAKTTRIVSLDLLFILQSLNSFNTWFWCRMSHFKHALMYWYYLLNSI